MTDFIVAYANNSTKYEWSMIAIHNDFRSAINHIQAILPEMTRSSLAIFSRSNNDPIYWADKRPRRIYNRHILNIADNPNGLISSALSGIINSRESDWF